ncbi:DUF2752 domain-containing protein [Anaerocellum danielii]|uniref:DUF2752 domain-containing protein n=1 Tax=Anaerocellum danielii TaxID=1387557 RepID=A0ABZ0U6X9_9FIRM|nr:DUF2752 domain-containing protein [Caldicellulosiruptor danielii]WPX10095.1 DUF2752 domain-containing protein [Caldicellulosiruptor danielii]
MCLLKTLWGIPCPGCGMTRALLAVLKGNLLAAFYYHPLWVVVILYPVIYTIFKAIKSKQDFYIWRNKSLKIIIRLFLFVWIIRMILFFPDIPPLDFEKNSLIGRLLQHLFHKL